MKNRGVLELVITCVLGIGFLLGCTRIQPTQLCDGFHSYERSRDVRSRLGELSTYWVEETKGTDSSDQRPSYRFLTMSGPFALSGIDGTLKLIFFNDRLMSAEFSTRNGPPYIAALMQQHKKVPTGAAQEITTDGGATFRYDIDPGGTFRFNWSDPQLQREWLKWVRDNS